VGDGWLPVAGKTVECPADGTGKYKRIEIVVTAITRELRGCWRRVAGNETDYDSRVNQMFNFGQMDQKDDRPSALAYAERN
jgi:hypothetical protein